MKSQLYIPTKIKVGYQNRGDTYTKRLAFVVAMDDKGKIRKEKSWEGWRDKKINPDEFDNTPRTGFVLNKDVKRSGEWFGSGRNMIRIYDDRGFEFEITTGNLLFILMTTNCHKRGLEGDFVYAWSGTELVLLPVDCDEYRNSSRFTKLQGQKVSAKQLVPGCSYKTKKDQDLIYLGRFEWLKRTWHRGVENMSAAKRHIFIDAKNVTYDMDPSNLAEQNTDIPVSNYAELVDIFLKSARASKAVKLLAETSSNKQKFYTFDDASGRWVEWQKYQWGNGEEYTTSYTIWMTVEGVLKREYRYSHDRTRYLPSKKMSLYVELENGEKVTLDKYMETIKGY